MSNENPTFTGETIKAKIKAHGERLEQVTTRVNNLRSELEQQTNQHVQLVGAIKGLQDLLGELPVPQPTPIVSEESKEVEAAANEGPQIPEPAEDS